MYTRVIGNGRAGSSMAIALRRAGWEVDGPLGRDRSVVAAAEGVDLVIIATGDGAIAGVADAMRAGPAAVVHLAGSLGPDILGHHERRCAVHPLISLPGGDVGADRLLAGGWFAVTGDEVGLALVDALGGRVLTVDEDQRVAYHAAAVIASNHVVALLGQVERIADSIGIPLEPFLDLASGSIENVARLGAAGALTGPAARGDHRTLDRHRAALPADELAAYDALVTEALRLAE